jgi:hypothetical protein
MSSPATVPIAPQSWLGWFLITTTASLLRSLRRYRRLSSYLRCYSPILYSATLVKGEPLVSEALAEGLCYKAGHGVRPFTFGFRLELDSFLYRTC